MKKQPERQKEESMKWSDRVAKGERERLAFREVLEKEHGLTGHPKASRLFELAWERGHANGWNDVKLEYGELATLLKSEE